MWLFSNSAMDGNVILKSGMKEDIDLQKIDVYKDLLHVKDITNITISDNEHLKNFDTIIPVYNNNQPLAFVLIGDIEEEMEGISPTIKHLHFIQTLSNIIIVAIENIRLFQENLRQEAIRRELELASRSSHFSFLINVHYLTMMKCTSAHIIFRISKSVGIITISWI